MFKGNLHIGCFKISIDMIEQHPNEIMKIMENMIIVRAECLYVDDAIQYQGISDKYFDIVGIGSVVPDYQFVMNDDRIIVNKLN